MSNIDIAQASSLAGTNIGLSGQIVLLETRDLEVLAESTGARLIVNQPESLGLLVAGVDPDSRVIQKAKQAGAMILTEREFLEHISAADLLKAANEEAQNPATSRLRLCQLAAVVPEGVATNPIWKLLYLENQHFLDSEEGLLKLRLMRLANWDEPFGKDEQLNDDPLPVDIYSIDNVTYDEQSSEDLRHSFQVEDYTITLYCHDLDADMEDVGEGCDDRLTLKDAIEAYFFKPFDCLQDVAENCGVTYEESMSPSNGYPMGMEGMIIECGSSEIEFELDRMPVDTGLIAKLIEESSDEYTGVSADDLGELRPLFSARPTVDDDGANEGWITATWSCECFIPANKPGTDSVVWLKRQINEEMTFSGTDVYGFSLDYSYKLPIDLESEIARQLGQITISRKLEPILLRVLGL